MSNAKHCKAPNEEFHYFIRRTLNKRTKKLIYYEHGKRMSTTATERQFKCQTEKKWRSACAMEHLRQIELWKLFFKLDLHFRSENISTTKWQANDRFDIIQDDLIQWKIQNEIIRFSVCKAPNFFYCRFLFLIRFDWIMWNDIFPMQMHLWSVQMNFSFRNKLSKFIWLNHIHHFMRKPFECWLPLFILMLVFHSFFKYWFDSSMTLILTLIQFTPFSINVHNRTRKSLFSLSLDLFRRWNERKWVETSKTITSKLNESSFHSNEMIDERQRPRPSVMNKVKWSDSNNVLTNARWCFACVHIPWLGAGMVVLLLLLPYHVSYFSWLSLLFSTLNLYI